MPQWVDEINKIPETLNHMDLIMVLKILGIATLKTLSVFAIIYITILLMKSTANNLRKTVIISSLGFLVIIIYSVLWLYLRILK